MNSNLPFLTDIAHHLSELNQKLQGKCQLVNKPFVFVRNFWGQFQVQLGIAMLNNFTCLATKKMQFPDLDSTKYAASVKKLRD